jgi:pimeloyl-ACP methyl ester carboxylesterase
VNRPSIYALATALVAGTAQAAPLPSTNATTTYHRVQVDGVGIFYREAGPRDAPTIVLLHGFPSSSREFDTVIPLLATKYHLIAPDYPGFGLSDALSPVDYTYTFDHLANTMRDLLEKLKVMNYTMYLHDYGAPIGFRIVLAHTGQLACAHHPKRQYL